MPQIPGRLARPILALVAASGTLFGGAAAAAPGRSASPAAAIGGARCAANRAAGPITWLSPFGYDASAGIIDVYAAASLGYFKALCLDVVTEAAPPAASSPVTLVSSGRGIITGVGSAADTLMLQANGARVVAVATYGNTSDYALLTGPKVRSLTELEGKTLGYKSTMPVVLTELLTRAGVAVDKVREVAVTTYDPAILPEGKVQALQVYQSNEPITLTAEHHPYREWTPAQFGVSGTFNTVVVNRAFKAAHPSAVADFLRAELHAFAYCAAHPTTCVDLEAKLQGRGYDRAHALAEWKLEAALASRHTLPGSGVGVESVAEWQPEAAALRNYGIVRQVPPLASALDTTTVRALYAGKQLLWPGS